MPSAMPDVGGTMVDADHELRSAPTVATAAGPRHC